MCLPPTGALSQAPAIAATIDVAKTGAPISKNIYGQFLEHGGDIVNAGIWSEMLVDRKFFYPVATVAPTPPLAIGNAAGDPRFENIPKRWWAPVGGDRVVKMDSKAPYTGKLSRMAPNSIDATVKAGSPAEVQAEEQSLGTWPATITLRPYSVNIYSYPLQ